MQSINNFRHGTKTVITVGNKTYPVSLVYSPKKSCIVRITRSFPASVTYTKICMFYDSREKTCKSYGRCIRGNIHYIYIEQSSIIAERLIELLEDEARYEEHKLDPKLYDKRLSINTKVPNKYNEADIQREFETRWDKQRRLENDIRTINDIIFKAIPDGIDKEEFICNMYDKIKLYLKYANFDKLKSLVKDETKENNS